MPETSALRTHYAQYGLDIVASDVIIAIILNAKGAPELHLRDMGTGSGTTSIRYGMTTDELEKVLADQPYRYEGLLDSCGPDPHETIGFVEPASGRLVRSIAPGKGPVDSIPTAQPCTSQPAAWSGAFLPPEQQAPKRARGKSIARWHRWRCG